MFILFSIHKSCWWHRSSRSWFVTNASLTWIEMFQPSVHISQFHGFNLVQFAHSYESLYSLNFPFAKCLSSNLLDIVPVPSLTKFISEGNFKNFWKIYWFLNFCILQLQMMTDEKIYSKCDTKHLTSACALLSTFAAECCQRRDSELSDPWLDLVQLLHICHVPINVVNCIFLDGEKNQEYFRNQVKEKNENNPSGTR